MVCSKRQGWAVGMVTLVIIGGGIAAATIIDLTMRDLFLPGTQPGSIASTAIMTSNQCQMCHAGINPSTDPHGTWSGSLMALAGKDPLFFAQMTLANQDVGGAGYYCMRCHVPMSFVTGHVSDTSGESLDATDRDGVTCHFCHSMVDPVYRPGISPPQDEGILVALAPHPPAHYGDAMFVLDPTGTRRGVRTDGSPLHPTLHSPFHLTGDLCGTCHEVGNIAVSRQADGRYFYNALDQPTDRPNPAEQFPLERTYSEWKLSAFAAGGVDMGGRFGGDGATLVSTCQDCHMPKVSGKACIVGANRSDLRSHEFAGAAAQVLDIIAAYTVNDPSVSQAAITRARAASVSMLERAASLQLTQLDARLVVRVTNESGHKIPTGHIEGRRIWVNVRFLDGSGNLVGERGSYDYTTADLDASSTTVYEMRVGLSPAAAAITGLPAGVTGHMALANTIEKDNRIPPRGFANAAFAAAGAPPVGTEYADGQYWHDSIYRAPIDAVSAEVGLYYQNTPKEYIEELWHNNHTDSWGQILHDLWLQTGRGSPILMAAASIELEPFCAADYNGDGGVDGDDTIAFFGDWDAAIRDADITGEGGVDSDDVIAFFGRWDSGC